MKPRPFKLERYFAQHEFTAPHLLCCSDCEPLSLGELLSLADAEMLELWQGLRLGYTESQGHPLLRQEIAKLYARIGARDVLVVAPQEGIFLAMNALLERGDHVVTTFPGYQSLYQVAEEIGCQVSRWAPDESNGWRFDVGSLEAHLRPNTKLIVINFPHNPTGALPDQGDLRMVVGMAQERGIAVFSDEIYRYLEYDASQRLDAVCDQYEDGGLSLGGLSKAFSLPGLRIGWLATRNESLLRELATMKDYTTICSSAPSEILATIGLRAKGQLIARNLSLIGDNLRLLDRFFAEHAESFSWVRPRAGSIAFPRLHSTMQISAFCSALLKAKGVLLLPADAFDYPTNHFRLGFGRAGMREALEKLSEYMREQAS